MKISKLFAYFVTAFAFFASVLSLFLNCICRSSVFCITYGWYGSGSLVRENVVRVLLEETGHALEILLPPVIFTLYELEIESVVP